MRWPAIYVLFSVRRRDVLFLFVLFFHRRRWIDELHIHLNFPHQKAKSVIMCILNFCREIKFWSRTRHRTIIYILIWSSSFFTIKSNKHLFPGSMNAIITCAVCNMHISFMLSSSPLIEWSNYLLYYLIFPLPIGFVFLTHLSWQCSLLIIFL